MAKVVMFFQRLLISGTGLLLALVITFSGGLGKANPPEAKNSAGLLSQLSVLSDVHMESYETFRFKGFAEALRGLPQEKNTLVMLGDNTMNGQITEYLVLYGLLNRYGPKNAVILPGNHDVRINSMSGGKSTIDDGNKRHMKYYGAYLNKLVKEPYFSRKIDGATIVVTASEQEIESVGDYYSQKQLDWIKETVLAAPDNEVVLIMSHDPMPGTFGQSFSGEQGLALKDWLMGLDKHIFFFSGHVHPSLNYVDVDTQGKLHFVNLPAFMSNESPTTTCLGFQVELYSGEVLLRLRNFSSGQWIEDKEFSINL